MKTKFSQRKFIYALIKKQEFSKGTTKQRYIQFCNSYNFWPFCQILQERRRDSLMGPIPHKFPNFSGPKSNS